jgi:hypothetical protein
MGEIENLISLISSRKTVMKDEYERVEKPLYPYSSISTSVLQKTLPLEEKKIIKYINLLKELIKSSEKDGTRGVKSHGALFKGQYLDAI